MIEPGLVQALAGRLEAILRARPQGLSEHELMVLLQDGEHPVFESDVFRDPVTLFRAHFLLFHTLHVLSDQLLAQGHGRVRVDPLHIALDQRPAGAGHELDRPDSLRAYYLDARNLERTTAEDVEAMLGRFWSRLYADEHRHDALAAFDLREPVDYAAIRHRYRQLVMEHHPDRGGDTAVLQQINDAMAVLTRLYAP